MKIETDKSLKEFTTFKIGGIAQFFCIIKDEEDLIKALDFVKEKEIPFFILGGGSNILISDRGFVGLVIKMEMRGIEFVEDEKVVVRAGEDWDTFVGITVERGLYGIENLSLIPGTVGAALVQNIGAYGSEVKDSIYSVRVFDTVDGVFKDFSSHDCQFTYRNSLFKRKVGRYIITAVTFILKKDGKVNINYKDVREYFAEKADPSLQDVRNAIIDIRTNKLPDVKKIGTAGSFFKNPVITHGQANELEKKFQGLPIYPLDDTYVKVSLAWILDKVCGYRGISRGNVGTYKNQALVLVNNGGATSEEVISFAEELKKNVKEKTGIDIEEEVQMIQ